MAKPMPDKKILKLPIVNYRFPLVFGLSIVAVMSLCSAVNAQRFDIEAYLKKIDVNGNGKLEESEMSDRTKGWIEKMGFDTNSTVSISKVVAKVDKDRRDSESGTTSTTKTTARKVPGFGVEAKESTSVARFDSSGSSASAKSAVKVSDSVMERVNSTLERYDRNKDGFLDRSEIRDARWGSPSPEESDKNKDGKLSRDELAARYGDREQYYRNSNSSSRGSSSSKEEEDRARRERDRERFRTSGRTSSSTSSSSRRPSTTYSSSSSSSPSSSADSQAKYQKYAESLISNYDKDKDGKLNRDEIKQMRRPPVGADADKDGFITQSELLDSLSGANKTSTASNGDKSASKSSERDSGSDRKDSRTGSSRTSSVRSGPSSSFEKLDVNSDRQVQMHEYSSEWDEEKVAEFYAKDKNGDGVITLKEWAGQE
jgi:Ca2+-binding EF-hand superfamily protein